PGGSLGDRPPPRAGHQRRLGVGRLRPSAGSPRRRPLPARGHLRPGHPRARRRPRMIEHVFVLMHENRSFDHMLGWSGLRGIDPVSGEQTAVDGLDGSEWNELPDGGRVAVAAGAEYALRIDPGHGFEDVLEQLCGRGATYPDAGGGYPAISNSGFASRVADQIRRSRTTEEPAVV